MTEMPHSLEAERALLGAILTEPALLLREVADLEVAHLHRHDHQALLLYLRQMADQGEPIDLVTLPRRIMAAGVEERVGGIGYVLELPDYAPSTANVGHYVDVIRGLAARRRVISACERAMAAARSDMPVDTIADGLRRVGMQVGAMTSTAGSGPTPGPQVVDETLRAIEDARMSAEAGVHGISSGLWSLDEQVGTRQPQQMTIVAARPAMGKTVLALTALKGALGICGWMPDASPEWHCGIFSMEMHRTTLGQRLLADLADVRFSDLRDGASVASDPEARIDLAARVLRQRDSWWVDDTPRLTAAQVVARCEEMHARRPLDLVVVDYLTLMGMERADRRDLAVGAACHDLREMARRLECHVVLLSQLSRGVESRDDKRPRSSDLRDSGELEQHADTVIMVYRPYVYDEMQDPGAAELIVTKARHGRTGTVHCRFNGEHQRFSDDGALR